MQRQMKLGLNIVANGAHAAGWRMPGAQADAAMDIRLWKRMAQAAERARFHFMFWADGIAVRHSARDDDELSYNPRIDVFEPLTLIGALAAVTERIGFLASASTTYNDPYHVARKFASLDHISEGRVGWNVVTSWSEQEAFNFGRDSHMEHALRYRRAEEFVDVVFGLWDSWEDDAFVRDKTGGQYFDPAKLHTLNHRGETFAVKGPLNVARPLQGYPVIAQAGSSGPGQDLGARIADLIYTAQKTKEDACAFYASVKAHGAAAGRDPDCHAGHARHPRHPGPHPAGRAGPVRPVAEPGASARRPADADGHVRGPDAPRSRWPPAAPAGPPQRGEKRARKARQAGRAARHDHPQGSTRSWPVLRATTWWWAPRRTWQTSWRTGSPAAPATGSTSCPPSCRSPRSRRSNGWCPNYSAAACSKPEYSGDGTMRGSLGLARPPHGSHRRRIS